MFTERTTLFVTIVAYVLQGYTISADKAFTMAQYFNILQLTMAIFYPRAVGCAAEANISLKRIEVVIILFPLIDFYCKIIGWNSYFVNLVQ